MTLSQEAAEYAQLGRDIADLSARRKLLKQTILSSVHSATTVTEDGIRITKFRKSIKDLPFTAFVQILKEQGEEAVYSICKVVQSRLSLQEKALLEKVGEGAEEIRVTGV